VAQGTPGLFGFDGGRRSGFLPSPLRRARVSLALWRTDLDDSTPLFGGSHDRPSTLVVIWPVCERGLLLEDLERACVSSWSLTPGQFERLAVLHRDFGLGEHDVWVRGQDGKGVWPCPESLLRHVLKHGGDLGHHLEREITAQRDELLRGMGR
jgi:hypothetical protein